MLAWYFTNKYIVCIGSNSSADPLRFSHSCEIPIKFISVEFIQKIPFVNSSSLIFAFFYYFFLY